MAPAADNPRLSKACRALLALIPTLDGAESQEQLAARLGCSVMTVHRSVHKLVTAGLLVRQRQDRGWAGHRPDRLAVTDAGLSLTASQLSSRAVQRDKEVQTLPPEVEQLRTAMREAGLTAGFGNLYPEVVAELVQRVRALGVRALVQAALAQTWGKVRHVAAYLARWRELRPPRPVHCAFHPGQPPRGCPDCAEHKARSVPMPTWLRAQIAGHPRHRTPDPLLST